MVTLAIGAQRRPTPMKKFKIIKLCPFCLKENVEGNSAHVFPKSWYLTSTRNVEKPHVEACVPCNSGASKWEEPLGRRLSTTLQIDRPDVREFYERMRRGADPSLARNEKEHRVRSSKLREMLKNWKFVPEGTGNPMPGTEQNGRGWAMTEGGVIARGGYGAPFDKVHIDAMVNQLVRGMYFWAYRDALPLECRIGVLWPKTSLWDRLVATTNELLNVGVMKEFNAAPSFHTRYAKAGDKYRTIWLFRLWGQFLFVGTSGDWTSAKSMMIESDSDARTGE